MPFPDVQKYRFLPHLGHPNMLPGVLMDTQGSGGHPLDLHDAGTTDRYGGSEITVALSLVLSCLGYLIPGSFKVPSLGVPWGYILSPASPLGAEMGARVEATRGSWAVPDMALHTVPWLSFATAIFHSQKPVALSLGCFSRAKWGDQSLQRVGPGPQVCSFTAIVLGRSVL